MSCTSRGRPPARKSPEVGVGHLDRSVLDETKRILETKTRRNPIRKSIPPRTPKQDKIRTGPGEAKSPDSAAVEIPYDFLFNRGYNRAILGPRRPRAHLGGFRGVRDGTSGGPPGETSKTINDTIQEHSFITSLFCLVVFGSLSFGSSS